MLYTCRLDVHADSLSEEISLDFTRAMNKILFDKTVATNPVTFPFVTIPEQEITPVPYKGIYMYYNTCICMYMYMHLHNTCI